MGLQCSISPPWEVWEWPKVFATSPRMTPRTYLAFRAVMALIFVAHLVAHLISRIITEGDGIRYFIELANWTFILETALMMSMLFADVLSIGELPVRYEDKDTPLPTPIQVTMALFSIAQPLSLLVTVLYWTVENPIWRVTHEELPDYLVFFAHGMNWILMMINFFVSRIPYSFQNSGWLMLFGAAYLAWTWVHYLLNIGTSHGCREYIRPECPIYDALDWHRPKDAAIVGSGVLLVACPLCIVLYLAMAFCRDRSDKKADVREMDEAVRRELEALKAQEMEDALRQATEEEKAQGFCLRCA